MKFVYLEDISPGSLVKDKNNPPDAITHGYIRGSQIPELLLITFATNFVNLSNPTPKMYPDSNETWQKTIHLFQEMWFPLIK